MLSYYRPGLDVSSLSDQQFITAIANLLRIREMEKVSSVENILKKFIGE